MKEGSGNLVILGDLERYDGGTTISQGTLQRLAHDGGAVGSIDGDIENILVFQRGDTVVFDGAISGTGALKKNAGGRLFLSAANTYEGGTTINDGWLNPYNITGSATGSGPVQVTANAYLGGYGSIEGVVTVNSGGSVAPGEHGIGTLIVGGVTFEDGSILATDLRGLAGDFDQIVATGNATINAGSTLDVSYFGPFSASPGDSFVILTAAALSGEFTNVNYPDAQNWTIEYDTVAGTVTVGICEDDDGDGVCNANDICHGFDDNVDTDGDGIPDGCDDCSDVNVYNVTQGTFHPTIQDAITTATNGDVIELGACTFFEDNIVFPNGVDVTLRGAGRDLTIIDGGGAANPSNPILKLVSSQTSATQITGLTLRNGNSDSNGGGGAVHIINTSPVFNDVAFQDNGTTGGGAKAAHVFANDASASPSFNRCEFTGGHDASEGLYTNGGSMTVLQCLFHDNDVPRLIRGSASIVNCTIDASNTVFLGTINATNSVFDGSISGAGVVTRCLYAGATGDNIDGLPTFEDAAGGDYRLAAGSLGIDAADYDAYTTVGGGATDLGGADRWVDDLCTIDSGTGVYTYLDMGAYEFQPDGTDGDGDGVPDGCDNCPNTISGAPVDANGCPDPAIPADFDNDGDVDQNDVDAFEACASGPAVPLTPGCEDKDFDDDNDTDQSDFAIVQRCISGEDVPGDPSCSQ